MWVKDFALVFFECHNVYCYVTENDEKLTSERYFKPSECDDKMPIIKKMWRMTYEYIQWYKRGTSFE